MDRIFWTCLLALIAQTLFALPNELQYLHDAYPNTLHEVTSTAIIWKNGRSLQIREGNFFNDLSSFFKMKPSDTGSLTIKNIHCDKYEPFFKNMYGNSATEVKSKLVIVYWMPQVFGKRYPLKVTTVNGIDKKVQRISDALVKLPMSYYKYLENPAGSFYWRNVKGQKYLSSHSFGIAIDINSHNANYWLWDWLKEKQPPGPLVYRNSVPPEIIKIFEKEGFLWGGRWYFYDTMHFEYRPELFTKEGKYHHEIGERC